MWVKGSKTGWISMSHNWGASYQAFAVLGGQSLSFRITSYTTKQTITSYNVAPANWVVGTTYKCNVNFRWSGIWLLPFIYKYEAIFALCILAFVFESTFPCFCSFSYVFWYQYESRDAHEWPTICFGKLVSLRLSKFLTAHYIYKLTSFTTHQRNVDISDQKGAWIQSFSSEQ